MTPNARVELSGLPRHGPFKKTHVPHHRVERQPIWCGWQLGPWRLVRGIRLFDERPLSDRFMLTKQQMLAALDGLIAEAVRLHAEFLTNLVPWTPEFVVWLKASESIYLKEPEVAFATNYQEKVWIPFSKDRVQDAFVDLAKELRAFGSVG